jgi:hypothetical protein
MASLASHAVTQRHLHKRGHVLGLKRMQDPSTHELSEQAQAFVDAARLLRGEVGAIGGLGAYLCARAADHLDRRLLDYLTPRLIPRTEQQAQAVLKGIALELATAGRALHAAAESLKVAGKATPASRARQAGNRALAVAEGLG